MWIERLLCERTPQLVLDRVHDPTPGSSNGVDQQQYTAKGDAWIRQQYPEINFIKTATVAAPRGGRGPVVEAQR